jgi:putative endonuclease
MPYPRPHYVYLLRSIPHPRRTYVGLTSDLRIRLRAHNTGRSTYTAKYRPWRLVTAIWFSEPSRAIALERYLKRGTGHAFARGHLWSPAAT